MSNFNSEYTDETIELSDTQTPDALKQENTGLLNSIIEFFKKVINYIHSMMVKMAIYLHIIEKKKSDDKDALLQDSIELEKTRGESLIHDKDGIDQEQGAEKSLPDEGIDLEFQPENVSLSVDSISDKNVSILHSSNGVEEILQDEGVDLKEDLLSVSSSVKYSITDKTKNIPIFHSTEAIRTDSIGEKSIRDLSIGDSQVSEEVVSRTHGFHVKNNVPQQEPSEGTVGHAIVASEDKYSSPYITHSNVFDKKYSPQIELGVGESVSQKSELHSEEEKPDDHQERKEHVDEQKVLVQDGAIPVDYKNTAPLQQLEPDFIAPEIKKSEIHYSEESPVDHQERKDHVDGQTVLVQDGDIPVDYKNTAPLQQLEPDFIASEIKKSEIHYSEESPVDHQESKDHVDEQTVLVQDGDIPVDDKNAAPPQQLESDFIVLEIKKSEIHSVEERLGDHQERKEHVDEQKVLVQDGAISVDDKNTAPPQQLESDFIASEVEKSEIHSEEEKAI